MKFYFKAKVILSAGLVCTLFSTILSCSSDSEHLMAKSDLSRSFQKQRNETQILGEFGHLFNKAVKNPLILEALKFEAEKQIDGDYDILLVKSLDTSSSLESLSLFSLLQSELDQSKTTSLYELIDYCSKNYPLLQIYMPTDQDFQNMDQFLTILLPSDFNDREDKTVNAINSKGELISLSANEEPSDPYMVISFNERFDVSPLDIPQNNPKQATFSSSHFNYYLSSICKDDQQSVALMNLKNTNRDPNNRDVYDVITRARFRSRDAIRDVESWVRGKPEVECRVLFHKKGSLLDFILGEATPLYVPMGEDNWYTGSRRKPNPCDNYGNWFIVRWVPLAKQTKMKYIFAEKDNGFSITINNDLTFRVHGGDDMGSQYVFWSDNVNRTYPASGLFEFEIGQRIY